MLNKIEKLIKEHESIMESGNLDSKHTGELQSDNIKTIYDICQIVKPKNILELGFNRGSSALMWLMCSEANLVSIDCSGHNNTPKVTDKPNSINFILEKFGKDRFNFIFEVHENLDRSSFGINTTIKREEFVDKFDIIFIDGRHSYNAVYRDTKNSLAFNTKYIVFDDYFHGHHAKDIQKIIKEDFKLDIIKEYKSGMGQALVKV